MLTAALILVRSQIIFAVATHSMPNLTRKITKNMTCQQDVSYHSIHAGNWLVALRLRPMDGRSNSSENAERPCLIHLAVTKNKPT
ncbi:hypothetical protein B0H66DRAFT_176701 [Apodospora peruviana]|uniref:Secreted protein n=1 Tax=Apodospora peruviana TaxID=516989 RepID=A0AAE0IAQ5_9PEZI|nr:hypothetical protein B0H66DRAFT_176701 [Apodospora peruviana]